MLLKFVFLLPFLLFTTAIDKTLLPETYNEDVVCEVINKIDNAGIFPDDKKMLRRIAYVESTFGEDRGTYRDCYHGGIWQVNKTGFVDIKNGKHPELYELWPKIEKLLRKRREDITWNDLRKPLFSGIFARLRLYVVKDTIPTELINQAKYWKAHYNSEKLMTLDDFTKHIDSLNKELGSDCNMCKGKMDLVIVMDGSRSIGNKDYKAGKDAAKRLITYSGESVRIGYVSFSDKVDVVFDGLKTKLTGDEMRKKITESKYLNGSTNTHLGIDEATSILSYSKGIPKVMVIFTDGKPNDVGSANAAADRAKKSDISIIAVGIGPNATKENLNHLTSDPSYALFVKSYQDLTDIVDTINSKTCKVPQRPDICEKVGNDPLLENEKRYFKLPLPCDGITLKMNNCDGKTKGYYSYDHPNPSSSINDGDFDKEVFIAPRKKARFVYATVQGRQNRNVWSLQSSEGNQLGKDLICEENTEDNLYGGRSGRSSLCGDLSGRDDICGDNDGGKNICVNRLSTDPICEDNTEGNFCGGRSGRSDLCGDLSGRDDICGDNDGGKIICVNRLSTNKRHGK